MHQRPSRRTPTDVEPAPRATARPACAGATVESAMSQRTDTFELGRLGLTSGEGRRLDLHTGMTPFHYGGEPYAVMPSSIPLRLDVSRTTANGWALRMRFAAQLE